VTKPLFPLGHGLLYRNSSHVAQVNEDPRVDLAAHDHANTFIRRGVLPAPWYLATDGMVTARAVDISAQEDARQFSWKGAGRVSVEGVPVDLSASLAAGADLLIDWRIDALPDPAARLALGGGALEVAALIGAVPAGTLLETRIPLRCFAEAGAKLSAVGNPLLIQAGAGFVATLRNVRVAEGTGVSACPKAAR
jgi:beta-glucosidase